VRLLRWALALFIALAPPVFAVAFATSATGCSGQMTAREGANVALTATAAGANAGAESVLAAMCTDELRAIGHVGTRRAGHCVRTDEAREATPEQRAELERTRARWALVRVAYDEFRHAHDFAVAVANATEAIESERYLSALSALYEAYESLREAAAPLGVFLPPLLDSRAA
jgi:hypothetical protein